ncbi:MAG: hypothetical protein PHR81_00220 [Bacteroidales bacterium]|jgi:antitoxin component YwqK of YwqJK toxin-antitoxin module|nr:hypothetical protein [Bacteroidales bacterium]MDD4213211.1 hypothetical protein [Bacteroidales bacterium]
MLKYCTIFLLLFSNCLFAQDSINNNGYNKFFYKNGSIKSQGLIIQGKPEGYWKNYYENGILKSEGNRKNFEIDSIWIFYNEKGDTLVKINYSQGKKNGIRTTYTGDEIIEENFENDIKKGFSYKYYPGRNLKYKVNYIDGREEGTAFEYSTDGNIITIIEYRKGYVINSENINRYREGLKHGVWKEFYENGQVKTEQNYSYGKKDGFYKEFDTKGNLIKIVKFKDDYEIPDAPELLKYDIKTEYYRNGKVKIVQSFKDDIPEGIRREYSQEGEITKSYIFKNGVVIGMGIVDESGYKQGPWKEYFDNGQVEGEGIYANSLKQGQWNYYFRSGKIEQKGTYNKNGKPEGRWIWYYESGNVRREEYYKNGLYDGKHLELSDSEKVIVSGEYVEGEEEGPWIYEVGDQKEEGSYVTGKREGPWTYYTGEMINFAGNYTEGNPDGLHTYYWENGNIKQQGKYIMGKKEGDWDMYDLDGIKIITIRYEDGVEISYDGNKIEKDVEK